MKWMNILKECEMAVDEIEEINCLIVKILLSERRVKKDKRSKDQKIKRNPIELILVSKFSIPRILEAVKTQLFLNISAVKFSKYVIS
jgi:hypothetical protein